LGERNFTTSGDRGVATLRDDNRIGKLSKQKSPPAETLSKLSAVAISRNDPGK
jgi:hypothetical protein